MLRASDHPNELCNFFAAAVMTGLCARPGYDPTAEDNDKIVNLAFELATKMHLKALEMEVAFEYGRTHAGANPNREPLPDLIDDAFDPTDEDY